MYRKAATVFARHEGTQPVRQRFRQHRHNPVREIDGIAALIRVAVQRLAGAHIPGYIGNGDDNVPAAFVVGVWIRFGPYRVVEIPRVGAVDGDKRYLAQIGPHGRRDRLCSFGSGYRFAGKLGRNVVGVDGNQAGCAGTGRIAYDVHDPRFGKTETAPADRLHLDQVAFRRPVLCAGYNREFGPNPAIGWNNPSLFAHHLKDAEHPRRRGFKPFDGSCRIGAVASGQEIGEDTVADG